MRTRKILDFIINDVRTHRICNQRRLRRLFKCTVSTSDLADRIERAQAKIAFLRNWIATHKMVKGWVNAHALGSRHERI